MHPLGQHLAPSQASLPTQHRAWRGERLCPSDPATVCNAPVQPEYHNFFNRPQESIARDGWGILLLQDF